MTLPDVDRQALDYDVTKTLYNVLIAVIHKTSVGVFTLSKGVWTNAKEGVQMDVAGREFVFGASWKTPIITTADEIYSMIAPPLAIGKIDGIIVPTDGSSPEHAF